MLRYKLLLDRTLYPEEPPSSNHALEPENPPPPSMRELAQRFGFPVTTLYSYVQLNATPRVENMGKMADYFGESISSLFSDDDDLTADLVAAVRALPAARKKALLKDLSPSSQSTRPRQHPKDTSTDTSKTKTATQQKR